MNCLSYFGTRCWIFHQWGKWHMKSDRTIGWVSMYVQQRECLRCGIIQEKNL